MAIMGELNDLSIADLLEMLARRNKTGKVTVKAEGREIDLYMSDGKLSQVSSSDPALRLGNMLVRRGALTPHQLLEVLHHQSEMGRSRPLGQILFSRGLVAAGELASCVEEQCIAVLSHLITAKHGVFIYVDGGVIAADDLAVVPPPLAQVLDEAIKRTEELMLWRARLPSTTSPLMIGQAQPDQLERLTNLEIKIVKLIGGAIGSFADLAAQLPIDELTLTRSVVSLRDRGLITIDEIPSPRR